MPVNNIQNIRSYSFDRSDRLFFDANIWLNINNPFGHTASDRARVYSNAYREIIGKGIKIHIDALVLSEFINRAARLRFELWKEEYPEKKDINFKQYRSTEDFKDTAKAIEAAVHSILIDCRPIETGFTHIDLSRLVSDYGVGQYDFNDLIIAEICKANQLVLVTDDGDYLGIPVPILTYNRRLLNM